MAAQATIAIDADTRDAIKNVERMASRFKRSFTEIDSALSIVGKAWGAVSGAVGAFVDITKESIKLAGIQEAAERDLAAALGLQGAATAENINRINAFNSSMQQRLGYGDEELLQLQKTLLAMGVHVDKLEEATKGTLALGRVMGGDLKDKAKVVAKALGGQAGALKEYGISAVDAADAQAKLNEMFKLAEIQAGSAAVQLDIMRANAGDMQESLGFAFTRSEAFTESIKFLGSVAAEVATFFASSDGFAIVNDVIKEILRSTSTLLDAFLGARKAATRFMDDLRMGWAKVKSFFTGEPTVIMEPITRADEASKALYQRLEDIADRLRGLSMRDFGEVKAPSFGEGPQAPGKDKPTESPQEKDARGFKKLEGVIKQYGSTRISVTKAIRKEEESASAMFQKELNQQVSAIMESGFVNAFAGIGEAIGGGFKDIGEVLKSAFGDMIKNLGMMLIQMGTAALIGGALGTVVPFLAPLTGGPAGAAAGAAAIAGGIAMVALGSAIGGTGGGAGTRARTNASTGGAPTRQTTPADRGGLPSGAGRFGDSLGGGNTTVNVNFSRGMVVGGKQEVARFITDHVRQGTQLSGSGRGGN